MADLVADAILAGTEAPDDGGAELALMNTGGVRASLRYNTITNGEQPGEITYAETYAVAPFNNILVTVDMTGAQIEQVLNQQYQRGGRTRLAADAVARRLRGLHLRVGVGRADVPAPNTQPGAGTTGGHVVPGSMELNGVPIEAGETYRVGTLNFLADGGDLFTGVHAPAPTGSVGLRTCRTWRTTSVPTRA